MVGFSVEPSVRCPCIGMGRRWAIDLSRWFAGTWCSSESEHGGLIDPCSPIIAREVKLVVQTLESALHQSRPCGWVFDQAFDDDCSCAKSVLHGPLVEVST